MENDYVELIHKQLLDELSPDERARLNDWLEADTRHKQIYQEVADLIKTSSKIGDEHFQNYKPNTERALEKLKSTTIGVKSNPSLLGINRKWMSIAASIILVAMAGWLWNGYNTNEIQRFDNLADVPIDIHLSDGSVVWLNKNASLSYQEKSGKRNVRLEGEAYFEVAEMKDKPFIISGSETTIEVLGTKFNYESGDDLSNSNVDVVEGKVKYSLNDDPDIQVILIKGDRAEYKKGAQKLVKSNSLTMNFLAWKSGSLKFQKTTLPDVFRDLEQHFEVKISFDEESLSACVFNSTVDKPNLDSILKNLELIFQIEVQKVSTSHYKISNGNCT